MTIPFGEGIIRWYETGRHDPDEAQDWLALELEKLGDRFKAEFPAVVARVETET